MVHPDSVYVFLNWSVLITYYINLLDSDTGHVKSSRKVYKNKGGGKTIVSKKTIIGGSKMTIGQNARNITINIGHNRNEPEVKQSNQPKQGNLS